MLLVDTNALIDVLEDDPRWADWSIDMLRRQSQVHRLAINPIIYAELSLTFSTVEALDEAVTDFGVEVAEISRPALLLAVKAFDAYCLALFDACPCLAAMKVRPRSVGRRWTKPGGGNRETRRGRSIGAQRYGHLSAARPRRYAMCMVLRHVRRVA